MLNFGWLEFELLDYLRELNPLSIAFRILLAMLIGGILGGERGRKHRPAGFRTYMLVSVGAALVMMTNQYTNAYFGGSGDVVRMGSQVVSGIGFLGAGTIIVTRRNQVKGITTAAGLWTAACSGLAIGIGFYEGAVIGGLSIFVIMVFMQRLDDFIHQNSRIMEMYLELENATPFSEFLDYAASHALIVADIQLSKNKAVDGRNFCAVVRVKSRTKRNHAQMLEVLEQAPGMLRMEEL